MGSNLAHQGAKLDKAAKRHEFYARTLTTEYDVLGIPRPDINIVLLVKPDMAHANMENRSTRSYTTNSRDIHEADIDHLEKAKRNYEEICLLYPKEFIAIDCMEGNSLRSIEDIQIKIQELLHKSLSA